MDSDAQRDILKMLAENVIDVNEAERLLKALNEGEKRKEDSPFRHRKHHHGIGEGMSDMFESLGDTLSNIGPMVKNTVGDMMSGIFGDDFCDWRNEDFIDIEPLEERYDISAGTCMVIAGDLKWKHGDLRIKGIAGNTCRIDNDDGQHMRIRRSPTHFVVQWIEGNLNVLVPETVSKLLVRSNGGDIRIADVQSDMNVLTMGGNLKLKELLKDFKVKTMGGDINLALNAGWNGKAKVRTMGGNIMLKVPDGLGFNADAFTMGGVISVAEGMKKVESGPSFPGKKSAKIRAGEYDSTSTISLKTMGGDITLREDTDAEQQ